LGLKKVLRSLKLVEFDTPAHAPKTPADPASGSGRTAKLQDILSDVEPPPEVDERKLPAPRDGGGLPFPQFSEVYAAAGIVEPAHGFSAFKVLEILEANELATLEPKAKAAALMGFLKMNPRGAVAIADVVQDAVRRDQALDKFEEFLRGKLADRAAQLEAENRALQAELNALQDRNRARMDRNREALDAERKKLEAWVEKKRAEERRLAASVEPFVEKSPISTGNP
jgi:hypothetical protein